MDTLGGLAPLKEGRRMALNPQQMLQVHTGLFRGAGEDAGRSGLASSLNH